MMGWYSVDYLFFGAGCPAFSGHTAQIRQMSHAMPVAPRKTLMAVMGQR